MKKIKYALIENSSNQIIEIQEKTFEVTENFRWEILPSDTSAKEGQFLVNKKIFEYSPSVDIQKLKDEKIAEINALRDLKLNSVFVYQETPFSIDANSRKNITAMLALLALDKDKFTVNWIDANGKIYSFTRFSFTEFASKLLEYTEALYFEARAEKDIILEMSDKDEIFNYDFSSFKSEINIKLNS